MCFGLENQFASNPWKKSSNSPKPCQHCFATVAVEGSFRDSRTTTWLSSISWIANTAAMIVLVDAVTASLHNPSSRASTASVCYSPSKSTLGASTAVVLRAQKVHTVQYSHFFPRAPPVLSFLNHIRRPSGPSARLALLQSTLSNLLYLMSHINAILRTRH